MHGLKKPTGDGRTLLRISERLDTQLCSTVPWGKMRGEMGNISKMVGKKKLLIELEKQSSENRILQTASIYNLLNNTLCAIHVFVIKESVLHCSPFSTTNFKLGNWECVCYIRCQKRYLFNYLSKLELLRHLNDCLFSLWYFFSISSNTCWWKGGYRCKSAISPTCGVVSCSFCMAPKSYAIVWYNNFIWNRFVGLSSSFHLKQCYLHVEELCNGC